MTTAENWKRQPLQTVVLTHDSDDLDPLEKRCLEAEEIILDILEDPTMPHGEDVKIELIDGSPW